MLFQEEPGLEGAVAHMGKFDGHGGDPRAAIPADHPVREGRQIQILRDSDALFLAESGKTQGHIIVGADDCVKFLPPAVKSVEAFRDEIVVEENIVIIPMEKKCKKAKWLSGEDLQIAEKRREAKSKGEKER